MIRSIRAVAVVCVLALPLGGCTWQEVKELVTNTMQSFSDNIPGWCARGEAYFRAWQLTQANIKYSQRDIDNVNKCAKTLHSICPPNSPPANQTVTATLLTLRSTVKCIQEAGRTK